MTNILLVDAQNLINSTAAELKKQKLVQPPQWSVFVKTGHHKERLPDNKDWWYVRAASILRTIARQGPVGTQKLRTKYGGRKNRGHKPDKFFIASGSVIRKILQQLDAAGLTKQAEKGVHKGRIVTPKGTSFLNSVAKTLNQ